MCYPKPAPRCSSCARKSLLAAEASGNAERLRRAKADYEITAEFTQYLREKARRVEAEGDPAQANRLMKRAHSLDAARQERMTAYKRLRVNYASDPKLPFDELDKLIDDRRECAEARVAGIRNLIVRHPIYSTFTLTEIAGMARIRLSAEQRASL